ncbi:MAG TPA: transglycosylase SLT domain-containing protein [Candidatus Acidoferrales bacterium]|jgi:soluble lytic murein transglycosylase-like protein|nr:transglycosylase SLT domain-containing protein [Candidatus Acidoferrales bacterium]
MRSALLFALAFAAPLYGADYFVPSHRISGIGVARDDISGEMLEVRADHMIQSQTFTIMRESQALAGARRITGSPKLQALFRQASESSGMPASIIEAISYLESWGDPKAESPAGPKGIMQISQATAAGMGLKVVWATRYKTTREKVPVKGRSRSGKTTYRTVSRKTPYKVMVRDDRLAPDRAIPAAARYLAGLEQKFGGRDWAIFAYHCGQGCVTMMQDLTRRARGITKSQITVPRMFFSCSPAWNRELYEAIQQQMQRDYSPTYWFRVMRAEQLLALYRRDPAEFAALAQEYKSEFVTAGRAPHRLAVWLKREDLLYHNEDDIRADPGKKLTKALDRPDHFGYRLNIAADSTENLEYFREAAPAAIGTLTYIAFETRRLFDEMAHTGGKFQPLDVTSLVAPEEFSKVKGRPEALAHASGQVFDVDYSALPPAEIECLRFVLDDLGWDGFLGFVEDGRDNLHIGCSPASRAFFTSVFQEAVGQG